MSISKAKVTDNLNEMCFHDLFNPDHQIQIPLFQREYVWSDRQWRRMAEELDIIVNGEDSNRFLGAVIAVRREANPAMPQPFEIVDGQQRLSTLYLFVMAAIFVAAKNGDDEYARGLIQKYAIIHWHNSGTNTKLIPSFADRNQFCKVYDALINTGTLSDWLGHKVKLPHRSGPESGRYYKQFQKIRKYLQNFYEDGGLESLNEILSAATTKLTFVFILLKDPSSATTVFEGLNDPGIPIGIGDLVRNEVFSKIANEPDRAQSVHEHTWLPFKNKLGEGFDNYFFPYAIIREPNITKADLFRGLRKIWGEVSDPEEIIMALNDYTDPYLAIHNGTIPYSYSNAVRDLLKRLNNYKPPTSIYPFVMKVLKEYENENLVESIVIEALETIESFLVRRSICGIEPTGLLALFRTVWNVTNGNPTKDAITKAISKRGTVEWPDNERVRTQILSRSIYKAPICKYILREYEISQGSDIPKNDFWIEHILPQVHTLEWKKIVTEEDHKNLVDTIGNLIPLTEDMNREVSTSIYKNKRASFANNSVFASARNLAKNYDKWDRESIIHRSETIANWATERWKK